MAVNASSSRIIRSAKSSQMRAAAAATSRTTCVTIRRMRAGSVKVSLRFKCISVAIDSRSLHFPFSILHLSFVIASIRSTAMANDKCNMENGKCLLMADYTTCVNFGSPYCHWRPRWVKMPPFYAEDFSYERRRVFFRRDMRPCPARSKRWAKSRWWRPLRSRARPRIH